MLHFFKSLSVLKFSLLIFLLPLVFNPSAKAQGEDPIFPWNAELRAGVVLPTSDFAETVDVGTDLGARFGYSLRERLMIRGDVETELYSGAVGFEDTQIWHYSGGVEYLFTDKGVTDWRLSGHGAIGASTVTVDNLTELKETYFSVNYGVKFGKGITDNFDWFVSVMGRTVFANPNDDTSTGTFTTVPISVGINHRFNLNDKPVRDKVEQPPN